MLLEDNSVARPGRSRTFGQRTADRSENLAGLTNNLVDQINCKERSNPNSAPPGELRLPKKPICWPGFSPGIANAGMDRCRHVKNFKVNSFVKAAMLSHECQSASHPSRLQLAFGRRALSVTPGRHGALHSFRRQRGLIGLTDIGIFVHVRD